jgi:acetyl esterase/lipase
MRPGMRILPRILVTGVALAGAAFIVLRLSPWPSALAIRLAFDIGGRQMNGALASHVPAGISAQLDQSYDPRDPRDRLDVFYPAAATRDAMPLLTVVWIHGGGFLAGSKQDIANYAKILASGGYTVAGVDYALAPENTYPTPLRQVNAALGFLTREAARLHVDPGRMVLAGDSAGALIAAQLANVTTSPDYARTLGIVPALRPAQIAGVLLYCGPYDVRPARPGAAPGWFLHTVLWSYFGRRDFANDPLLPTLRIVDYLTPQFPPSFISVGNADSLSRQSHSLAVALQRRGVSVHSLFFDANHLPPLPHEYQFNLQSAEGQQALAESLKFLATLR